MIKMEFKLPEEVNKKLEILKMDYALFKMNYENILISDIINLIEDEYELRNPIKNL